MIQVITIGRDPSNNIVIADERVSRTHLQLVQDGQGNISVVDLGSANGTYVNGVRIVSETWLKPGDEVRIGTTVLPWKDYFQPATPAPAEPFQGASYAQPHKRIPTWAFVAGGVLLALLVAGGIMLFAGGKENSEDIDKEVQYKEQEIRLVQAQRDAADAAAEYEKAQKEAAESKSAEAQKRAVELKKEADEKKDLVTKLKKDAENTQAELEKTRRAKTQAEQNGKQEQASKIRAEQKADSLGKEVTKAQAEKKEAEGRAQDSKEEVKLISEFYKHLLSADKNKLKEVCRSIGIDDSGNEKDRRDRIVNKFNNTKDNVEKCDIVDKLKNAAAKGGSGNLTKADGSAGKDPEKGDKGKADSLDKTTRK